MAKSKKSTKAEQKPTVTAVADPRTPEQINNDYRNLCLALGETLYRRTQSFVQETEINQKIDELGREMAIASPFHQAKAQKEQAAKEAAAQATGSAGPLKQ